MINFQDFILKNNTPVEIRDYWADLQRNKPNSNYFAVEPNWGDMPIEKRAYNCAIIQKLFKDIAPNWIYKKEYYLDKPYFVYKTDNMLRLILMIESPFEFKSRNIFVSKNALERV